VSTFVPSRFSYSNYLDKPLITFVLLAALLCIFVLNKEMYHIVVFKSKETVSNNNRIILILPTNRLPMPSTYWDVCCLVRSMKLRESCIVFGLKTIAHKDRGYYGKKVGIPKAWHKVERARPPRMD
jgi:hypothetical protein